MSVRNLEYLFKPSAVAVVGASDRPHSVGAVVMLELRTQGWSFVRIATEIGVAKSTLVEWSRKFRFELNNLRDLELDDLHQRLFGTHEARLSAIAAQLARVEAELAERDITPSRNAAGRLRPTR